MTRPIALLGAALLLAVATAASATEPTPDPPADADALARRVHLAAGGDRFDEIESLRFRFVVVDGGEPVFAADHEWRPHERSDRVTWTDADGRAIDARVNLTTRDAEVLVDGTPASAEELPELARLAYRRWVNDSYWLVLPIKLFDDGVIRAREPERDTDFHEVLRLSYENVGLTPGDTYWLFVDRTSAQIVRWEMVLEGQEPPAKGFSWIDHREVGPLVLAHDHVSDDGSRHIRFENVSATTR